MDAEKGPNPIREAFEILAPFMGKPIRQPFDPDNRLQPLFELARHFQREGATPEDGGIPGYTANSYKGAHLSIPCFDEEDGVAVLEISNHKGATHIDVVRFSGGPTHSAVTRMLGLY